MAGGRKNKSPKISIKPESTPCGAGIKEKVRQILYIAAQPAHRLDFFIDKLLKKGKCPLIVPHRRRKDKEKILDRGT
jgi:hypothetical protein